MIIFFRKNSFYVLFFLILFLGFAIRIWDLDKNPAGFFCDEASMGYNAYQILKTGKDEYGVKFPPLSQTLGDYRLTLPMYLNIPAIILFGLSEFSIRFTGVIIGLTGIIFLMLISKEIFDWKTSLFIGLLLAINPWHIHFSRWGIECIFFPTFLSISIYFLLKSLKKSFYLPISFLLFGLTMYTYYATLIITPLFIVAAIIFWLLKNKKNNLLYLLISLLIYFLINIPLYKAFKSGQLLTRWKSMNKEKVQLDVKIKNSLNTYFNNISLDFLFLKGDQNFVTRHNVRDTGVLYLFQLPFLIIGLIYVVLRKKYNSYLMLWLLILFPLGNTVINENPATTRSLVGTLPLTFFSGVGLERATTLFHSIKIKKIKSFLYVITFVIIVFSVCSYTLKLFRDYPLYSSDYLGWQYGFRPAMEYFKKEENNFDELLITHRFNGTEGLMKFYNVIFKCANCRVMSNPIRIDISRKQLFALRQDDVDEARKLYPQLKFNQVKIIYLPNKKPEIFIGHFLPNKSL